MLKPTRYVFIRKKWMYWSVKCFSQLLFVWWINYMLLRCTGGWQLLLPQCGDHFYSLHHPGQFLQMLLPQSSVWWRSFWLFWRFCVTLVSFCLHACHSLENIIRCRPFNHKFLIIPMIQRVDSNNIYRLHKNLPCESYIYQNLPLHS